MRFSDVISARLTTATVACFIWLMACDVLAEIRTITAKGEYRMGDNDTRIQARELALVQAKRRALEEAGIHLTSISEVNEFRLTRDELRTYAGALMEIVSDDVSYRTEGQTQIAVVELTARIDTATLVAGIEALRERQSSREEFGLLSKQMEQLQVNVDALTRQLQAITLPNEKEELRQQRQAALSNLTASDRLARRLLEDVTYTKRVGDVSIRPIAVHVSRFGVEIVLEFLNHSDRPLEIGGPDGTSTVVRGYARVTDNEGTQYSIERGSGFAAGWRNSGWVGIPVVLNPQSREEVAFRGRVSSANRSPDEFSISITYALYNKASQRATVHTISFSDIKPRN